MWHEETRSNSFVPGQKTCIFRIVKFQLFIKMNENEFLFRTIFHRNSRFIFSDSFNLHTFHLYHKVLAYDYKNCLTLRLVNCLCNITLGESFSNQNAKENQNTDNH